MQQTFRMAMVALVAVTMSLAACGGNNTSGNNGNNGNNNGNNTNNGNNGNNGTNNGGSNNATNNGNNNSNNANNTNNTNNNTGGIEAPPSCDDPMPPPRCDDDPAGFDWGSASVVTEFAIEGPDANGDPTCCFDFNGDGEIDNELGGLLASLPDDQIGSINDGIQESIAGGSLTLVLEHDGLMDLMAGDFTVNFWLAEHDVMDFTGADPAGGNPVLIDPASIDMGTQSLAYLPDATLSNGTVTAGPGVVNIQIEVLDSPLDLTISDARIEADVDAANSALDGTGVALTSGRLGGVIRVEDIYAALNGFASTCDCLGLEGDLVDYDEQQMSASCQELDTSTCDPGNASGCTCESDDTCVQLVDNCTLISAIGFVADIDSTGDGNLDAVSVGASFTAAGADIQGVAGQAQ